ncbi:MAG: bifunctional [glutamate--ammonia ligase]-adenylyl-L-tyrosine phosphorylase/[glutamate--ammonia-ligase] adenylyltransferase [Isosphaeraceae bacterium]|nr:bifunctional [glutamate--ammonia ligase]-adenylyl-L-tyrosine phosphorylase/[glutamate--ammonia-ligase] adenylyltransferase [Isosphaeraceae bacterium]
MSRAPFQSAESFRRFLEDPVAAKLWLAGLGVRDDAKGFRDLRDLAAPSRADADVLRLGNALDRSLPRCPDAGMALTNLGRLIDGSPDSDRLLRSLVDAPRALEIALQLLSTSQFFSELLIGNPALLDDLRSDPERRDPRRLVDELDRALQGCESEQEQRLIIRRFRRREILRIGYNDIIRDLPLELTTLDLSNLADACVENAYRIARRNAEQRHGTPRGEGGRATRFVVLALGKLGGRELNYSSDIDLIFLYEDDGQTSGPRVVGNSEYFARLGGEIVRLLADHTALGIAYRVDMRLRPEGDQGPLARSLRSTLGYYERAGRTWERQALIKCRPIAGDLELGREFIEAITPFVYRRYLSGAEIGEIKAMKRRIEQRTDSAGVADLEVKTGRGGIRDVEFVVQFLQLLHGGAQIEVRHAGTLGAMARLESIGCLTAEERGIMEQTYRFLRKVEHRLQTMFDLQTHEMPRDPEELRKLALRLGYPPLSVWEDRTGPAQRFIHEYRAKTELNRRILNHLLHDAFRSDDDAPVDPIYDLVLAPAPTREQIAAAFSGFRFRDLETAYRNLEALAREDSPFLSQARCRHFLAAIAPQLLRAVDRAPDPDLTLTNLEKVSASLGAKAILWELFSFNPPSLRLYVELCSTSQFLSEILINNPGMVDDLMDSLVVDRPQTLSEIKAELSEVCKGAEDLAPILQSFRNKEWVRIGTCDILGREAIRDVTRELSDVAEAIVVQVAKDVWKRRQDRDADASTLADFDWAIVALGRLGGRELNYHSDLDLIFLYESRRSGGDRSDPSALDHEADFAAAELARKVLKVLEENSGLGRLYAVDTRLRPHGSSGPLATTLDRFVQYSQMQAHPWERLALTRARVVHATSGFNLRVNEAIRRILGSPISADALFAEMAEMRRRQAAATSATDLKRGAGGLADVEFLVQALQLISFGTKLEVTRPNTWDALDALRRAKVIDRAAHAQLTESYDFLRSVESRLRIVQNRSTRSWPETPREFALLARRLDYVGPEDRIGAAVSDDLARHRARIRGIFREIIPAVDA